jgi:hypothetical protein
MIQIIFNQEIKSFDFLNLFYYDSSKKSLKKSFSWGAEIKVFSSKTMARFFYYESFLGLVVK